MDRPTMLGARRVDTDTEALVSYLPVPGYGVLPVNAFVIRSAQPVLVDTGMAAVGAEFMRALAAVIPPRELLWIWLTHTDPDHVGNLRPVLDAAPDARVVTTYLGMVKLGLLGLPLDRVHLLNPGDTLDVGDRRLICLRPPSFDAPDTTGLFDSRTRALFSADSFGALLDAPVSTAAEIPPEDLRDALVMWSTVDAPWLHAVDEGKYGRSLDFVRRLEASIVLSAHLPPAVGMADTLLAHLAAARAAPPFVGPDQSDLIAMMGAGARAA
jgi:glyoxylase-like metal-dependent hydrolase (beta-lactamase superfamily II)